MKSKTNKQLRVPVCSSLQDVEKHIPSACQYKKDGKGVCIKKTAAGIKDAAKYVGCSVDDLKAFIARTGTSVVKVVIYLKPSAEKAGRAGQYIFHQESLDELRHTYKKTKTLSGTGETIVEKSKKAKKAKSSKNKVSLESDVGLCSPAPSTTKKKKVKTGRTKTVEIDDLTTELGKDLTLESDEDRDILAHMTICPKFIDKLTYTSDLVVRVVGAKLLTRFLENNPNSGIPEDTEIGMEYDEDEDVTMAVMVSIADDVEFALPLGTLLK